MSIEKSEARESFIRWQAITRNHFTVISNVVLGLSVGLLGFLCNAFLNDGHELLITMICGGLSIFLLAGSIGLALWCNIIRLHDFRITAQIARARSKGESVRPETRRESKVLGELSWGLFWWQLVLFGLGVLVSVLAVLARELEVLHVKWTVMSPDIVTLNIFALLISGMGIFLSIVKFESGYLRVGFYGTNPFAVKRAHIDRVSTAVYMTIFLGGLLVQLSALILDDANVVPKRLYEISTYVVLTLATFLALCIAYSILKKIIMAISRKRWQPEVIELQRQLFESIIATLDKVQAHTPPSPSVDETTQENLSILEELFELEPASDAANYRARVERLKPFFG